MPGIGGRIEDLQTLEEVFRKESGTVEDLTRVITTKLGETEWEGPAADRFRGSWETEFGPSLRKLSQALVDAGTEVARRRQALIDAGS